MLVSNGCSVTHSSFAGFEVDFVSICGHDFGSDVNFVWICHPTIRLQIDAIEGMSVNCFTRNVNEIVYNFLECLGLDGLMVLSNMRGCFYS